MLITIPAWWFLSNSYLQPMANKAAIRLPHVVEHDGFHDLASPALRKPSLVDEPAGEAYESAPASSGFEVAVQVLLTFSLPAVVATMISIYLFTRYRRMQIRREIQRHALEAITNLAAGKQPPFTTDSYGGSS
jgi:hypothetical protein